MDMNCVLILLEQVLKTKKNVKLNLKMDHVFFKQPQQVIQVEVCLYHYYTVMSLRLLIQE
jgi:hypothetical protein